MNVSILDYGARTGDALQTAAIQQAIDACFLSGGGEVRVPAGIYRISCIRLRSRVTLYLEAGAVLEGSTDPEDYLCYLQDQVEPIETYDDPKISRSVYPYSRWMNAMIRVHNAEDVAIIGEKGSFINGGDCFDAQGEEGYRGPHGICIHDSRSIRLEGYTLRNCGNWAHAIFKTQDIAMRNVTVYGGHDGFDVRVCDNVLVEDCTFITGDDCIAGFDNNDVIVRRCYMESSCSLFRFGGNNVLVEDCTSRAPAGYGFRKGLTMEQKQANAPTDANCRHNTLNVFLYYCDHRADPRRTPGDIFIRNCRFENADRLFSLEFDGKHIWCCNRSLSSIRFENCIAAGLNQPALIYGDVNEPLTLELRSVTLTAREGFEGEAVINARNYERIALKNVRIAGYEKPRIEIHTEGEISMKNTDEVEIVRAEDN